MKKWSKNQKLVFWSVLTTVGAAVLMLSPDAWATSTGLITDVKNTANLVSYVPEIETGVLTAGGISAIGYGGLHIHKKGEMESQGKSVTMKHIVFPMVAGAILTAAPWFTGSAQKTLLGHGSRNTATAGTPSSSSKF